MLFCALLCQTVVCIGVHLWTVSFCGVQVVLWTVGVVLDSIEILIGSSCPVFQMLINFWLVCNSVEIWRAGGPRALFERVLDFCSRWRLEDLTSGPIPMMFLIYIWRMIRETDPNNQGKQKYGMLISFDIRVFHSSDIYGLLAVPMILKISVRDQQWNKRARLRGDDLCKMQSLSISKVWPWLQNQLYVYSSSILHWFCVSLPMIYNQSKKSNWRRKKTHFYETYSNIVSLILLQHWHLVSCSMLIRNYPV